MYLGDAPLPVIPVAFRATAALAVLGLSGLALTGRRKRRSNRLSRFVLAHPSHILMYAPGDSLRRRLAVTRNAAGMGFPLVFR